MLVCTQHFPFWGRCLRPKFAVLLSLSLGPSLCVQLPADRVQETPWSSTASHSETELGETDDSLTGSFSPLTFLSLLVPNISNPTILIVTSIGNFDREAFYREIIKP